MTDALIRSTVVGSMAGSRLEKLGTVFSRTRDLIRVGTIKENEKPIWYDVYAAFPPKREPTYVKPPRRRNKLPSSVPTILYSEDVPRAKFYEIYGSSETFHLYQKNFRSNSQRFVEKYTELQKAGEVSEDKLFEETAKALLVEGILLRRTRSSWIPNQQSSVPRSRQKTTVESTSVETSE